jgi:geranylgeranyl pyrophosphate synthase
VHSLSHASGKQKKLLDAVFGNRKASEDEVKQVFAAFQDVGSVEYARTLAVSYNKKAKDAISTLKQSSAKELLSALVDYSIQREK